MALATLACASPAEKKTEAAQAAVRRFFAELPGKDCAVLGPLLATGGSARPCAQTVEELHSHGFELVTLVDAAVDGRDASAVLVRAKVARDGAVREEPVILRVELHDGVWKLRL
jgi:orotate phosphoribosyltransferase-like protein